MGAYLSSPVTEKHQEFGEIDWLRYGSTSMQGWRTNQEDAHNCIVDKDENFGFFAVYDGHGGAEVSTYVAQVLPQILRDQPLWKEGKYGEALQKTFLDFDKLLLEESSITEMRRIKDKLDGTKPRKNVTLDEDELFEEAVALSHEANIHIDDLIAQYTGIRKKMFQRVEKRERNGEESAYAKKIKRAKIVDEDELASEEDEVNGESTCEKDEIPDLDGRQDSQKENAEVKSEDSGIQSNHVPLEPLKNGDVYSSVEQSLPSDLEPTKTLDKIGETSAIEEKIIEATILKIESSSSETLDIVGEKSKRNHIRASGDSSGDYNEQNPDTASATSSQLELSIHSTQVSSSDEEDEDYADEEEEAEGDSDDDDTEENESDEDEDTDWMAMDDGIEASKPGVDSGTTACVVTLFKNQIVVANVGDSRAVLSRNGAAIDLSVDHKPEDDTEKTRIEKAGGTISEDGRVNGGLNLSRALGDHYYKANKTIPLEEQMISPLPDIVLHEITPDDKFLVVACDGIWNSMSSQQVVSFVQERIGTQPLTEIGAEICDRCCASDTSGDGTGCDNMTVIIVDLVPKSREIVLPKTNDEPSEPPADPAV